MATHGNSYFRPQCIFTLQEFMLIQPLKQRCLKGIPVLDNSVSLRTQLFPAVQRDRWTNLHILQILSPFILPTTLESKHFYPHSVGEETGPQRQGEVLQPASQLGSCREPGLSSDRNSHYLLYNTPSQKDNAYQKIKSLARLYHWFPGTNPLPQFP